MQLPFSPYFCPQLIWVEKGAHPLLIVQQSSPLHKETWVCVVGAAYLSQLHWVRSRAAGRALGQAGVVAQGCLQSASALPVPVMQELAGSPAEPNSWGGRAISVVGRRLGQGDAVLNDSFSCLCGSLVPAKLRSDLLWLKEEKDGVGAADRAASDYSLWFPPHPSHCCSSRKGRTGCGCNGREKQLGGGKAGPDSASSSSPSPPELGGVHLCKTAAACGPSLENASSSTRLEPCFPPVPSSTQDACVADVHMYGFVPFLFSRN